MANASDLPRSDSVEAFNEALKGHSKVVSVNSDGDYKIRVELVNGQCLNVFMTNIYVVGEADVREKLQGDPSIDAIVTLSSWNMVSESASSYGKDREVGVFKWRDFFGAINYKKFWYYEPIPFDLDGEELSIEKRRRRREWN